MFEYTQEMADSLIKSLEQVEVKADESDKDWSFDVIATTENADRDGEIVKIKGWDISNWEKNPVILANHKYSVENIVGKGTKFYTSNGTKRLKGVFSKTNPLAVLVRDMYNEGMIKAVSVGFLVKERDPNDRAVITKAELLEISFVAVPCNPEALSQDKKELYTKGLEAGLINEEIVEEVVESKEITIKDVNDRLDKIESMLKSLVDGKTKSDAEIEQKETLQLIVRAANDALAKAKRN